MGELIEGVLAVVIDDDDDADDLLPRGPCITQSIMRFLAL